MLFQTLRISNATLPSINLFLRLFARYHSLLGLACDVQFDHNAGKHHPKSQIIYFILWVSFAFEPPGNSPNRHMAGEEFWRGDNNGIVAPKIRMKMGTEIWKMNILCKYCISISISIKFSWNGKIQDTIMYYHYDRKIRCLSHWSKSFIAVMSSSSHCNSFLQFSRESKSVWSPGF